jgi:hypothetical protein
MSNMGPNLRMVDLSSLYRCTQPPKGIDSGISEISSRVKFISRIQRGEKVDTRHMLVHNDSLYHQICRTIFSTPDRNCTYQFVDYTIKLCFEIVSVCRQSLKIEDQYTVINLVNDLRSAVKGINNLKDTYIEDRMFCCKLDTLIQEIASHLAAIDEDIGLTADASASAPASASVSIPRMERPEEGEDYSTVAGTPPS